MRLVRLSWRTYALLTVDGKLSYPFLFLFLFLCLFFVFWDRLAVHLRLGLSSPWLASGLLWSPCLSLLNAAITDMCHHTGQYPGLKSRDPTFKKLLPEDSHLFPDRSFIFTMGNLQALSIFTGEVGLLIKGTDNCKDFLVSKSCITNSLPLPIKVENTSVHLGYIKTLLKYFFQVALLTNLEFISVN